MKGASVFRHFGSGYLFKKLSDSSLTCPAHSVPLANIARNKQIRKEAK